MIAENPFLRMRNVRKVYGAGTVETTALDDFTVDFREGEYVAVTGPSGCGKSTLLNIVAMLDAPTTGQYLLGGVEVSGASDARLTEIRRGNFGFVFQSFQLI